MKKVIILTHGKMSEGIVDSLSVITGGNDNVTSLTVGLSDSPDEILHRLSEVVDQYGPDDTVIVLTDIPAGSTTTNAIRCLGEGTHHPFHLISGTNLGLLLGVYMQSFDDTDVAETIRNLVQDAKDTIVYVNDMFTENNQ